MSCFCWLVLEMHSSIIFLSSLLAPKDSVSWGCTSFELWHKRLVVTKFSSEQCIFWSTCAGFAQIFLFLETLPEIFFVSYPLTLAEMDSQNGRGSPILFCIILLRWLARQKCVWPTWCTLHDVLWSWRRYARVTFMYLAAFIAMQKSFSSVCSACAGYFLW